MTKFKITSEYKETKDSFEHLEGRSETVQGMAYSINDLIIKRISGEEFSLRDGIYEGEEIEDYNSLNDPDIDLVDLHEAKNHIQTIKEIQEEEENTRKKQSKAQLKADKEELEQLRQEKKKTSKNNLKSNPSNPETDEKL